MSEITKGFLVAAICFLLFSCAKTPSEIRQQVTSELFLSNKIKVSRERQFIISSLSRVVISVEPYSKEKEQDKHFQPLIARGAQSATSTVFASSSLLNHLSDPSVNQADYWLVLVPLNLVDGFQSSSDETPAEVSEATNGGNENGDIFYSDPHQAVLKINLYDARTEQLLDTAVVNGRSGALFTKPFDAFIETLMIAYGKKMTSHQPVVAY